MEKYLRPKLVPLLTTLVGIPLLLLVIVTAHTGMGLMNQKLPVYLAGEKIKDEVARFHSSIERYIYISASPQGRSEIFYHLDRAEWYANALLFGGKDGEMVYAPLKDPALRADVERVISGIKSLRVFANGRLRLGPEGRASRELEQVFDPMVDNVISKADQAASALRATVIGDRRDFLRRVYMLLALCLLLSAFTVTVIYIYLKNVKKAEDDTASARAYLQTVIDAVPDMLMIIDKDYNISLVNRASADFFRKRKPVKCYEFSHGRERPCENADWPCPLRAVMESGRPFMVEHTHPLDGRCRYVEILAAPTRGADGRVTGIVASMRDVSERKELERQRADFYAMITHDLKSPLTSILGNADLLLSGQAGRCDDEAREMLESMLRGGMRLYGIVEDFLTLSKIESGQKPEMARVYITDALKESIKEVEPAARQKGLDLKTEIPEGLPELLIDKRSIQRAVINLLQNAVKFTPAGGTVTLAAGKRLAEGMESVEVSVADSGPGIPPEEQERVFDKYYRSPRTAGIKGSGLGLAIVKAVAESHGGSVELESEEGRGSTFRLLLPVG